MSLVCFGVNEAREAISGDVQLALAGLSNSPRVAGLPTNSSSTTLAVEAVESDTSRPPISHQAAYWRLYIPAPRADAVACCARLKPPE
ncbi:hypothetical protein O3W52_27240 [Ensifer psoraleae]|uniref:Uncharacterized protein n=1 Tax=Sinorhizobium psoraleae TaxID=520838 RepID=A0ABT4KNU9_9HYPH|nr:hypothetical protein [Sinorhizobium psoraleae]